MCDIRRNLRCARGVVPPPLKIQTPARRRRDWSQLQPRSHFSERGRQRLLFIAFFSVAAELWTRSLFASSNKFKCIQVLFKGRHSPCEQACVHNVLCTAHFCLYSRQVSSRRRGCLFSNSSGIIREWSPDAAALRQFIRGWLLLNDFPFAQGSALKVLFRKTRRKKGGS